MSNWVDQFSDYLVFVDESGDHGLENIDKNFPVFALAFVLIRKEDYVNQLVPEFQRLKLKYWGHDQVILHERDIRKEKKDFSLLMTNEKLRNDFFKDINQIIEDIPFTCFASVINKRKLTEKYTFPFNPYSIGLLFCLEKTYSYLKKKKQIQKITHFVIESRGKKENSELADEFFKICDNHHNWGYIQTDFKQASFIMKLIDKKSNSSGLQLADLIARPIALEIIRPKQENRAYEIIEPKLQGIKVFP